MPKFAFTNPTQKYISSMMKTFVTIVLITLTSLLSTAQEEPANTFGIDIDLMSRGELRRGGLPADDDGNSESKAAFILERTRLGLNYERAVLSARVTAQHSAVWGQAGKGSLNIYEAWAQLRSRSGFFARVGRQVLSYDDERIIGSNDWAMAALSHDVLKLGYEYGEHRLHVLGAYNQNAESVNGGTVYVNGDKPYKTMELAWYNFAPVRVPLSVSLLFMNTGMQGWIDDKSHDFLQQLFGSYIKYSPRQWNVEASFYYQTGKNESGIPIRAWMASAKCSYNPSNRWKIGVGYDHLSGDKYFAVPPAGAIGLTRHSVIRGFSPIYGSHHKFYGAMDFFYLSTYVNGFTPGLQNLYFGATYKPRDRVTLDAAYHYYATATDITDHNVGRTLGHSIEVQAKWNIIDNVALSTGYTYMHGTEAMERLKRVEKDHNLHWAWVSFTVNPRLFYVKR